MIRRALFTALIMTSAHVQAAGFESSLPFGAETAGRAGIGSPYIQGSQALFFNPAGLKTDQPGRDLSLNLSPGWGDFKGPIANTDAQESSKRKILFPFGLMYSQSVGENVGVGAGAYVAGGSYAKFSGIEFAGLNGASELKSDLTLLEFALGASYQISENLKIGAAWRILMAQANFSIISPTATGVRNSEMTDLQDTRFTGVKLGAQYKLNEKTNLGFTYRGEVGFNAKGKISGTDYGVGPSTPLPENDVHVGSVFPAAFTFGVAHQCVENWKGYAEYVMTQYSRVTNLAINEAGQIGTPAELKWKDQHELRLASEYLGGNLPLRMGYIWSSKVTNPDYAGATFTPPGPANTLTLGSGKSLTLASGTLQFNGALEYGWSKGQGTGTTATYELKSYGIHMGAQYSF